MSTRIILELLLAVALRVTVVFGVAGLAYLLACWCRASAAYRHLIWSVAIVASLSLPLFGSVLPPLHVPVPRALRRTAVAVAAQSLGEGRASSLQRAPRQSLAIPTQVSDAALPTASPAPKPAPVSLLQLLLALYVGGGLVFAAGIARDRWMLARLTRAAREVSDIRWLTLLESLGARADLRRGVRLLRADAAITPLTAGMIRPVIVIPASAEEWPQHRREAVLLHELAHVARHDCLTQTLAAVACAIYWPNPLVWLAAARLRVDRELACDDAVLARGASPREYARDLLDIAHALSAAVPKLAVSMAGVGKLEWRIRSLIDHARSRRAPSRRTTSLAMGGACVAALFGAIVRPTPIAAAVSPRFGGQFAARLTTPTDGPENQGRVHVMLWTPGINTFYSELRELAGLTREQLLTEGAPVKFVLRRDAGNLEFTGVVRQGSAQGQFAFSADTNFNRALADRGVAAVTAEEQFSFARHNLTLEFLDELKRLGYATPTRTELVLAATSGADVEYLREMNALGYRARSLGDLVALSNEGVVPAFVRQLAAIGYRGLPVTDLLHLRNEDIDSSFIARANARAGRRLTVAELILLRLRPSEKVETPPPVDRVDSEPPSEPFGDDTVTTGRWALHTLRDGTLQLDIEWANVNQWRRTIRVGDLTALDGSGFRMEQDAGIFSFEGRFDGSAGGGDFSFTPNKDFLRTLRSLGVRDADRIGIHQLKNLAFGFMSADRVRGFMAEGIAPLSLHDVVDLAVYQITPEFVRQVKALGYTDLTLRRLVDLRMGAAVPKSAGSDFE